MDGENRDSEIQARYLPRYAKNMISNCSLLRTVENSVFTRAKSFDRWISTKKENLFAVGLVDCTLHRY